jgi:sugar phosphate isomerase/epimerase
VRAGYHTSGLQNHRLEDALRLVADAGYAVVALTPDVMHLDPFRSTAAEVGAIGTLLERLGLEVVVETGARFVLDPTCKHEPTLMTRDPAARARRLDYTRRCAALGADLGAKVVSFWAGIDRAPGPDSRTLLDAGVDASCAAVRAAGLVPAFEPEPGMAVETVGAYRELCLRLGEAAPALTLDIGHLYAVWEGDPAAAIGGCADRLVQVHLEDMRRGVHEHLLPGTGDVDFHAVLSALKEVGYEGPVCFELSRSSHAAPEALRTCKATWDRVATNLAR